jgi:hypothetical protein
MMFLTLEFTHYSFFAIPSLRSGGKTFQRRLPPVTGNATVPLDA